MKRRAWIGGGVALLAAGAGAGLALWRSRAAPGEAVADTEAALWRMRFERPAGGELVMASLRGRPLLLNFWATWCAPCVREMPMLEQFHRERQREGWQVVGLAIDSLAPVREYLTRLPMSFPIGLTGASGVDLLRGFGHAHGNLPFSVVFNRAGHVLETKLGAVAPADLARWAQDAADAKFAGGRMSSD